MSVRWTSAVMFASFLLCRAVQGQGADDAPPSPEDKQACVDAASHGQLERDGGRLLEARQQLLACARDACPAIVRRSCVQWLSELEPRIPSIVVRIRDGSDRDVTDVQANLDGIPITLDGRPIPLNPGKHTLTAQPADLAPVEHTFLLLEAEAARLVSLELRPPPTAAPPLAPPPPPKPAPVRDPDFVVPVGAWILGGSAVVSLLTFTGFAVAATDEYDHLKDRCAPACTDADTRDFDAYRVTADVALGVGLAALAGAAAWTLLAQPDESSATVSILPVRHGAIGSLTARF